MRGAPSPADADRVDLRMAARELGEATEMIAAAHTLGTRGERAAAFHEAVARLELASRMIDEVVDRRQPRPVRRRPRRARKLVESRL